MHLIEELPLPSSASMIALLHHPHVGLDKANVLQNHLLTHEPLLESDELAPRVTGVYPGASIQQLRKVRMREHGLQTLSETIRNNSTMLTKILLS